VVGGALAYDVWATVEGGGLSAQAGAVRLGVSRALQAFDPQHRAVLKQHRLLTQDDRQVQRRKPNVLLMCCLCVANVLLMCARWSVRSPANPRPGSSSSGSRGRCRDFFSLPKW
jgi:hypothetical protein